MNLTNVFGLPESFLGVLKNDPYDSGGADYTATALIAPPQQVVLRKRYDSQLVEDVSDRIWALLGSAVHYILEKGSPQNALQEERIIIDVIGRKIGGKADLYHNGKISDYKVTTTYSRNNEGRLSDWTSQLNIYAWLFRQAGFPVTDLEVVFIYRDWSKARQRQSQDYPPRNSECMKLKLWTDTECLTYIEEKVLTLIACETTPDDSLPQCTKEDMWEKEDVWAVMKEDGKRAISGGLCKSLEEAEAVLAEKKPKGGFVQLRPAERTRCQYYCSVRDYCSQFMKHCAGMPPKNEDEAEVK